MRLAVLFHDLKTESHRFTLKDDQALGEKLVGYHRRGRGVTEVVRGGAESSSRRCLRGEAPRGTRRRLELEFRLYSEYTDSSWRWFSAKAVGIHTQEVSESYIPQKRSSTGAQASWSRRVEIAGAPGAAETRGGTDFKRAGRVQKHADEATSGRGWEKVVKGCRNDGEGGVGVEEAVRVRNVWLGRGLNWSSWRQLSKYSTPQPTCQLQAKLILERELPGVHPTTNHPIAWRAEESSCCWPP